MEQALGLPDWEAVRAEFPAIGLSVYLNTAGGGPLPRSVAAAGIGFYEEMRDVGDRLWPVWLERVEETRAKVANYINAPADCVAFTPNTSYAMNLVAGYLRQRGVTSVVSMADSFPAITVPLAHHGFDTTLLPSAADGTVTADDVRNALTNHTGALVVSSVEYGTGYAHELRALRDICDEHRLPFVVDARWLIPRG